MANIFFASDHHIGHAGILTFMTPFGTRCREFDSVEHMHDRMLTEHNAVVRPQDKVYFLGDVVMHKRWLPFIGLMNGHKRLVRGNHDIEKTRLYLDYFDEVYASRVFDDMILTHIPIREDSIKPEWTNVHGHVHNNVTATHYGPKYFNVCVEMINYRPLALEELRGAIRKQQGICAAMNQPVAAGTA